MLVTRLRRRFAAAPNVDVVGGDALRVPLPADRSASSPTSPSDRTTAILRRLLDDPQVPLARADLLVELDVAWKRARCSPSTALGAYWGAW